MATIPLEIGTEFMISFLFVLAIVFGALQIANVFKSKSVNAVIGIAIALFASMYQPFQTALWGYMPNVTWFFIIMFFIAFVMEIMGFRKQKPVGLESIILQTGVLFALLSVGYLMAQMYTLDLPIVGNSENLVFLVGLLVIISLFMSVLKLNLPLGVPEQEGKG